MNLLIPAQANYQMMPCQVNAQQEW